MEKATLTIPTGTYDETTQKYIHEILQNLQPQNHIGFTILQKFINIFFGLLCIATIGSFIMLFLLNNKKKKHWALRRDGESINFLDCFYFHCATLSTVGYGDITAISIEAKLYTIFLIIVTMVELVAIFDIISISSITDIINNN